MTVKNNLIHPAYIWIGAPSIARQQVLAFIKHVLCQNSACNGCVECKKIDNLQHYLLRWIEPDNKYVTSNLDIIFNTTSLSLEAGEHFFFVLAQADMLGTSCSNSLLKVLEEPPAGYHFLLYAQRIDGILPTILSRCIINYCDTTTTVQHPLVTFFSPEKKTALVEFSKELEQSKILEKEALDIHDHIYYMWVKKLQEALKHQKQAEILQAEKVIALLDKARYYGPMPGSAKIYLRNLFLQCMVA